MAIDAAPDAPPFAAERYDLGDGLGVARMTGDEGRAMGAACAAMEPWLSYPFSDAQLSAFFTTCEPDAPRFAVRSASPAALAGAVLAGALVVRRNWFRGPYIHMLVVLPPWQGRGLGARLLGWAEAEARAGGDRNLWIAVTETNLGARRLYERFGFAAVATLDGLVTDHRSEVLMRKRLG